MLIDKTKISTYLSLLFKTQQVNYEILSERSRSKKSIINFLKKIISQKSSVESFLSRKKTLR